MKINTARIVRLTLIGLLGGIVFITLKEIWESYERIGELDLPLMASRNDSRHQTAFTVSIEARVGVTTGISASDRARTISVAIDPTKSNDDIASPGHVFPLVSSQGGVIVRAGHTEAAVDVSRLAGLNPSGVICEIMNEDGTMARLPELIKFAQHHELKIGTIADLIHYRVINERTVEKVSEGTINTDHGEFALHSYKDLLNGSIHLAMVKGDVVNSESPLVRVQVKSSVRDLLGSQPSDKATWNMQRSLKRIAEEGSGVVVLLAHQESPADILVSVDIALGKKSKPDPAADGAHKAQMTVGLGSQILRDVGVSKFRLMGAPVKYNALSGFDLELVDFVTP